MLHTLPMADLAQAAQTVGVLLSLLGITLGCITAANGGQR